MWETVAVWASIVGGGLAVLGVMIGGVRWLRRRGRADPLPRNVATVVDVTADLPRILRAGAVSREAIERPPGRAVAD